ncbi:PQQ-dependent sugar dehydrogenase [Cereibacter azotoformans]|uniref:Glucose sorbosone dehydrogenase n=1 Tax=Cereibacter sphaeroides (strain ATCC 17025 / ATH 2.4.3) TaxID=349102 RepID=A4WVF0_CERS5|nr:PQQ-dependent sugar dehydrogenase [Cereibacter azotoformans]ULB10584.1 PQQ-dependent sugar dehydrogenase [Cereibacter azotoformans]
MKRLMPLALLLAPATALAQPVEQGPANTDFEPAFENQTRAPALPDTEVEARSFVGGLEHPWGIATLPEGGWLVTERPGRLRVVSEDGDLSDPIAGLPEVDARRQGGLLDVAVGPDFANDRRIYWTYAKSVEGGTVTAAARGILSDDLTEVTEVEDIFVQEPPSAAAMHYGSRIVFDGEGHAFITTGEHSIEAERDRAQDLGTSYGKVIRVALDGSVPEGNPFAEGEGLETIWTYGHRNIQSADFAPDGRLWIIEHGPKGGDELNLIEAGANYGWPEVSYGVNYDGTPIGTGEPRGEGFTEPAYYWDPVIAPAGMVFYQGAAFEGWQGNLLVSSLSPGGLVRLEIDGDRVAGEEHLLREVGRVRDVEETAEGELLLLIDAPDGEILRVTPATPEG